MLDATTSEITDSNPYMTELLGYTREEMCGKELADIGVFEDKAHAKAAMERLQRALEAAGAEFTNGEQPGVRLTQAAAIQLRETDRAHKLAIAKRLGGDRAAKRPKRRR